MKRHFDDVLLGSIELFCRAAEAGSFTAAALAAGVTPAAVSRSISRLEKRLGVRLFVRTTRSIRLTDGGRHYFDQCRQALSQLVDAERQVTGEQLQPAGILRISSPTPFGHYRLLPALPAFRARHPLIKVEAQLSNRNVMFLEEDFDIAIRVRIPPDSNMIARLLEDSVLVLVGSPDYLKHAGVPQTLDDLAQHDCIQFDLPSSGRKIPWLFRQAGEDREVLSEGNYSCSEEVLAGVTLARSGAGLFQAYRFSVEKDLADGTLVEVLQEFGGRSRPHSLIYPYGRMLPLRVRAFIEFMVEQSRQWETRPVAAPKKAAPRT